MGSLEYLWAEGAEGRIALKWGVGRSARQVIEKVAIGRAEEAFEIGRMGNPQIRNYKISSRTGLGPIYDLVISVLSLPIRPISNCLLPLTSHQSSPF